MQELEKILEEIEQAKREPWYRLSNYDVKHKLDGAINRIVDIIRKHMNDGWIPVEERLPEDERYIFLSFENFSLPMIGRYEQDSDGSGNFYIGDETESCINQDMYVTAWQPLPEPYRPERSVH